MIKKIVVLCVVLFILPGLILFSGDQAKTKKGAELSTVNGYTRHWKDADKTTLDKRPGPRDMRAILNFENPKKIVKKGQAADPVVQSDVPAKLTREGMLMPAPINHFAGMNFNQNGAGWPPDTCGDVGINHYVQAVNTSIGIYNKSTGAVISTTTFDDFFEGPGVQGTPCDEYNNGDPIVLYDQYAQRWIIFDFAWQGTANGSWFSIAASKTSDPTGAWWLYAFHADRTLMNDYPKGGVWTDGIYITANMFIFNGNFQHAKIWAFKKPDIYNGTLVVQSVTDDAWEAWSILPSHAKGTNPPPEGAPNYMYTIDADEYGAPGQDAIFWWRYIVDWNNPANTVWDGSYILPVAAYGLTSSRVPQPCGSTLDSLFGRLMNPAIYRNFGSYGAVYLNHVAEYSGRRTERWYEIRINGGVSSIYQQSTFAPDTNHRWMGSIAADKYGNIAIGYSVSSSSLYPSIRYAGRLATDPLNQLAQGEASMIEGTGCQYTYTRWGDYSSMSIDPVDDETFWYTNEYYITNGTNWQTRIGYFKFPPPPPAAPTNLTATAVSCNQIDLAWTDNANNEDGFAIERSLDGTVFAQLGTIPANQTTFSDTTVLASTTYWYRVRAFNAGGYSAYSNTASATTPSCSYPPAAPTNLTATALSCTQIRLTWQDNADNEDGFAIERSRNGTIFAQIGTIGANQTTFIDTVPAVTPDVRPPTYWYRVRAFNDVGYSDYSNTARVTPPHCTPAAPSDLKGEQTGKEEVTLWWKDNSDDEELFIVYRGLLSPASISADFWEPIAKLKPDTEKYVDQPVKPGYAYSYKVCAVNKVGESCSKAIDVKVE